MFKRTFYSLLLLGMTAPALAKVEAVDGYVRLLPPGTPNTAAFMVLKNDANQAVKLVAASSPAAGRAELHTHLHENGVMKMRQVESIEIPAKGEVVLKPG
ncbi:copper chaperone PCu(A)C, partial [Aeromonas enteropelogenes]|uniref:copper chaperone PCu(A)C n=1 Tax=Aeromonas enteropelogenes TaxID=29489 RepID=UPI0021AB06C5